jgi:hypothetical protein
VSLRIATKFSYTENISLLIEILIVFTFNQNVIFFYQFPGLRNNNISTTNITHIMQMTNIIIIMHADK